MQHAVTQEEMRVWEDNTLKLEGVEAETLLLRAARAVANRALERTHSGEGIAFVCGKGNNGADALAAARILHRSHRVVSAYLVFDIERLSDAAARQAELTRAAGVPVLPFTMAAGFHGASLIVDGIFGTGLKLNAPMPETIQNAIAAINASAAAVLCIDLPSGIQSDSGAVCTCAVCGDETVTFQYVKRGIVLYPGRSYAGEVTVAPISDGTHRFDSPSNTFILDAEDIRRLLPERRADSHKGDFGKALLIAGSGMYAGAALMSAAAALRGGTGILNVAVPGRVQDAFARLPEAVCVSVGSDEIWGREANQRALLMLRGKTAVAMGPGMGQMEEKSLLQGILDSKIPAVLDADALNLLSKCPEQIKRLHPGVILTPHPGEMSRLTGMDTAEITAAPADAAVQWAGRWNCVVLLKGAVSCIASPEGELRMNASGNPGLAKGGSGDVLTGLILAMLSQGLRGMNAASAGAYILGTSAEEAFRILGNRMLLARDVIEAIEQTVKEHT